MVRDRESAALMFERLWQRTGTEPLTVQPSLAISPPSAQLLLLPEQLPLQPDTSDTFRAQPITQPVSTTPFPPNPGSAALVTSTIDSVATKTERMDKEIIVE